MPPADAFEKIAIYANQYGNEDGKPYFSIDGENIITKEQWSKMRAKFYCPIGMTNVWQIPQLRGKERIKINQKAVHLNQKPLEIISNIVKMTSDEGDVIWDPFAGLCTTAIAAMNLNRICYLAENNEEVYSIACSRLKSEL